MLAGMLLAFLVVSLLLLSQKGLFIDDSMHMPAGYSYLLTHDYRLNQEHPPLIKLLSGLGLWRLQPQFPFDSPGWQQAATPEDPEDGMVKIEEAFFAANANQFEQIAWYGRLPVLVIPLLLLAAVWWLTRELFGPAAALIAVFLLGTEPNVIGNAIVVQNDVASALALVLFVIAVKKFLTNDLATHQPAAARALVPRALLLGGALGLALVTKYSLVVLVPVTVAILIAWATLQLLRRKSRFLSLTLCVSLVFLTAYLILIAFYSFHVSLFSFPPLLPRYFVYGIDMVIRDSREGRPAFLFGQVSDTGWWYYFPVAFALKTTIPFLLASVSGFVWSLVQVFRRKSRSLRERYVPLYAVLPALAYLGLTMTSHLNIGVRHLLPMFPFAAILGGGFISAVIQFPLKRSMTPKRGRVLAVVLAVLILAPFLVIAISTYPNYLTYFSPLAGGTEHGWQTLSDSNVETGQEVKALAAYLKAHGENRVTGIMVGGEFLRFYGVELEDFPGWYDDDDPDDTQNGQDAPDDDSAEDNSEQEAPETDTTASTINTKYVAIGAWYFSEIDLSDKQKQIIDVYRHEKPEAMVGNSIFVFRQVNGSDSVSQSRLNSTRAGSTIPSRYSDRSAAISCRYGNSGLMAWSFKSPCYVKSRQGARASFVCLVNPLPSPVGSNVRIRGANTR